jgi:hypothetical protein
VRRLAVVQTAAATVDELYALAAGRSCWPERGPRYVPIEQQRARVARDQAARDRELGQAYRRLDELTGQPAIDPAVVRAAIRRAAPVGRAPSTFDAAGFRAAVARGTR